MEPQLKENERDIMIPQEQNLDCEKVSNKEISDGDIFYSFVSQIVEKPNENA